MSDLLRDRLRRNVDALLLQRDMTRSDLATLLGRSPSAVSQWLNGRNSTPLETLDRIATALEVDISDLIRKMLPNPTDGVTFPDTAPEKSTILPSDRGQVVNAEFGALPDESLAVIEGYLRDTVGTLGQLSARASVAASTIRRHREKISETARQRRVRRSDAG